MCNMIDTLPPLKGPVIAAEARAASREMCKMLDTFTRTLMANSPYAVPEAQQKLHFWAKLTVKIFLPHHQQASLFIEKCSGRILVNRHTLSK